MLISDLVNPFASCVWEWHALHRVSHSFKTLLILNVHPYISLLKCIALTYTHRFWLSLFLSCLFYMLLNHVFVASARLCFLYAHLHLLWVSIDFRGSMILFLCTWYPNANILRVHKSWGASLVSLEHFVALLHFSWGSIDLGGVTILFCARCIQL